MIKIVDSNTAHFRIGWEPSPDNFQLVRYHALSSDHNRIDAEARIKKFEEQISQRGPIIVIRQMKRIRPKESGLIRIFQTFDSNFPPSDINFRILGRNIIKDYRFCERIAGNIERYLECVYNSN